MYLLRPCVELKLKNATKENKETAKGVIRRRTSILYYLYIYPFRKSKYS
jgi:hypothetical protein